MEHLRAAAHIMADRVEVLQAAQQGPHIMVQLEKPQVIIPVVAAVAVVLLL
jgi:formate-dependent phosphoribosylglycinamide formyltransferase (GAR transformylase)